MRIENFIIENDGSNKPAMYIPFNNQCEGIQISITQARDGEISCGRLQRKKNGYKK